MDVTDASFQIASEAAFGDGTWSARADYSDGDSKGIYQLQAIVRYGLGRERQYGLMFGYRYKQAKFEHDGLEEKYKYHGPLIGFNFLL